MENCQPPDAAEHVRRGLAYARRHEFAEAIAHLPEPLREVLVLRHYEDMRFEAMARLLDVPASTLKSRFAVALSRLRVRLQQLGWNPEEIDR